MIDKNNNMQYDIKYMKMGVFLLLMTNSIFLYSQNIMEIYDLSKYNVITGPNDGYSGTESAQWQLYRIISENYSSEIIENEYFKTESVISKIYLYWILRERNWNNISIIYEDLMNYKEYKLWFSPGWCLMYSEPINIEYIINFNYNDIQMYLSDYELFNYSDNNEYPYQNTEQYFMSGYLNIPYLNIEN